MKGWVYRLERRTKTSNNNVGFTRAMYTIYIYRGEINAFIMKARLPLNSKHIPHPALISPTPGPLTQSIWSICTH